MENLRLRKDVLESSLSDRSILWMIVEHFRLGEQVNKIVKYIHFLEMVSQLVFNYI